MLALIAGVALACTDQDDCSGHGTCDDGDCACEFGWQPAEDCSVRLTDFLGHEYDAYWWVCLVINVLIFATSLTGAVTSWRLARIEGRSPLTLSVKSLAAIAASSGSRIVHLAIGFSLGGAFERGADNVQAVFVLLAFSFALRFWLTLVPPAEASFVPKFRRYLTFALPIVVCLLFPCIILSVVAPPPLGPLFTIVYFIILGGYITTTGVIFVRYAVVILRELRARQATLGSTLGSNELTRKTDAFLIKFTRLGLISTALIPVSHVIFVFFILDGGPVNPSAFMWGMPAIRSQEAMFLFIGLLLLDPIVSGKMTPREVFEILFRSDAVKRRRRAEAAALDQRIAQARASRASDRAFTSQDEAFDVAVKETGGAEEDADGDLRAVQDSIVDISNSILDGGMGDFNDAIPVDIGDEPRKSSSSRRKKSKSK